MRELNLIPYEIKEKESKKERKRKYISYAMLTLCIIFVIAYFPIMYSISREQKAAGLKNQVDSKAYISENYNKLQTAISNMNLSINITKGVEENKVLLATSIDNLSKYVPTNIKFINLNYQNGSFAITGSSSNYNSCTEFIANLETSKEFPTAVINNITYKKETKTYYFSINIPQKEVENNEQTK